MAIKTCTITTEDCSSHRNPAWSPAEFKSIREHLGLTLDYLATRTGVALRSVQRWESGERPIPSDVQALLLDMWIRADEEVTKLITYGRGLLDGEGVMFIRYRTDTDLAKFEPELHEWPAAAYAAIVSRARAVLWFQGPTGIQYMEPDAYLAWLGSSKDSQETRHKWALSVGRLSTPIERHASMPAGPVGKNYR